VKGGEYLEGGNEIKRFHFLKKWEKTKHINMVMGKIMIAKGKF
jgi:hypothetical protein